MTIRGRVKLSGVVEIVCLHGIPKRKVTSLAADLRTTDVHECPCCQNLFQTDKGDPVLMCHNCRPKEAR